MNTPSSKRTFSDGRDSADWHDGALGAFGLGRRVLRDAGPLEAEARRARSCHKWMHGEPPSGPQKSGRIPNVRLAHQKSSINGNGWVKSVRAFQDDFGGSFRGRPRGQDAMSGTGRLAMRTCRHSSRWHGTRPRPQLGHAFSQVIPAFPAVFFWLKSGVGRSRCFRVFIRTGNLA